MSIMNNEKGLTIVELLVALVIMTIFGSIITLVLNNGLSTYKNTSIQNEMRTEADIIMTTIIKETYS